MMENHWGFICMLRTRIFISILSPINTTAPLSGQVAPEGRQWLAVVVVSKIPGSNPTEAGLKRRKFYLPHISCAFRKRRVFLRCYLGSASVLVYIQPVQTNIFACSSTKLIFELNARFYVINFYLFNTLYVLFKQLKMDSRSYQAIISFRLGSCLLFNM